MPRYPNGKIPMDVLHQFNSGRTVHTINGRQVIEDWVWALTPGTYQKHLALVALAKRNTGRTLTPSAGYSCYRPYAAQVFARSLYGNGAAWPGTSSHGGWWESRDTMAIDYHNWSSVYNGDRGKFYADVRAVGLTPGMISTGRGYPDEPWHVIDFDPWRAVPAGGGSTPFPLPEQGQEEPKVDEDIMRDEPFIIQHRGSLYAAGPGISGGFLYLTPEMHDVATAGYWALSNGKPLFAEMPIFQTKDNDRAFDILKLMYADPSSTVNVDVNEEDIAARVIAGLSPEIIAQKLVDYGIGKDVVEAIGKALLGES